MTRRFPAIRLTSKQWTERIKARSDYHLDSVKQRAEDLFIDGLFPTETTLPPKVRWMQYLDVTTDLMDFARLADPNYERDFRDGYRTDAPGSNWWKNALMVEGEFTKQAKDFIKLNERFAEEVAE